MKVTLAQLNYTIGDFSGNLQKIKNAIKENNTSDIIIFSELAISGYYPFDLLDRRDFLDAHQAALEQIIKFTENLNCYVLIGAIAKNTRGKGKEIYNAALLIHKGKLVSQYYKHLLPVYNIHDEARHFESGQLSPVMQIKGKNFAVFVCEDIWHKAQGYASIDPVLQCTQPDIEGVFVLNASPSNIGKSSARKEVVTYLAKKLQAPVVYVNQVGGNDEIVFDGASFVTDSQGNIIHQAKIFEEDILTLDFPFQTGNQIIECIRTYESFLFEQLKLGLRDYIQKCGFKGIVVGCSGGIDSALVIAIATYALGAENVFAITMPSVYSSEGSVLDSEALCKNLGVKLYTRPIGEEFQLSCKQYEESFGKPPSKLTKENIQARIRGRVVMEFSNDNGVLAVSTGNKSEMSVGYATLYGDMNGAINLLGDLYKQDVYAVSKYINEIYGEKIPPAIITKEPSAELSEDQKDSDSLPPYDLLDATLKLYIEGDMLDKEEVDKLKTLESKLPQSEVKRIHRLVDFAEFKRKQAPPIIRVQRRSFGLGRQLPVAQRYTHNKLDL